ncbi:MAG: hypothetical protein ACLUI3_14625 [Christensenellales bacterium]
MLLARMICARRASKGIDKAAAPVRRANGKQRQPAARRAFVREAGRTPSYGVLAEADREAFEQVLGELGRTGLDEQLRILSEADGRHISGREPAPDAADARR